MNEYLIAFIIVIAIFGIALFFISRKDNKREQYAKGFKWGKLEHKSESACTVFLVIAFITLIAHLYINVVVVEYIAIGILVMALICRLIASIAHKLEKHYMDNLRFGGHK